MPAIVSSASSGPRPARANASSSPPTFLSGTSRETARKRTGAALGSLRTARNGSGSNAWRLTVTAAGSAPRETKRARAALLAAMKPSARPASQRCTRSCAAGSVSSTQGVHSLKMTSAARRRRQYAQARSAAGPYSQATTTAGSKRRSSRSSPRGQMTGVAPARPRWSARSSTAS